MDTITTDRLILRPFRASDAEALFAYLHQPSASCFYSMALADMAAAEAEAARRSTGSEFIAVALRDSDVLIGDLFGMEPEEGPGAFDGDTYSLGWNFNPAYGGAGYATEAAQALVDHLFTAGHARRLYAYVEDHNLASQRLCERLGMRQEGLFLDYISFRNEAGEPVYENTMQYALLKREWAAQQRRSA
ncbi:GNAT family protein [Devosia sp. FKR38]|uniref:GNAT family N-acetyltransferase n=1 Tax=Devosia sp. FKR38 TaxID=2562312 RepID=UPI0010C0A447|nr:GNAT family protein [Devosia sp. FKR38]